MRIANSLTRAVLNTAATWEAQGYTATIHLGPLIWYDRLELSSLLTFPHKLTA